MKHTPWLRLTAAAVTVAVVASGCGGDDDDSATAAPDAAEETPTVEGLVSEVPVADDFDPEATFRWGYSVGPSSLDPHRGTNSADQNYLYPVYDRLVYSAPSGEYEPMLAESWTIDEDGTVLTFQLREGVVFHDGEELDAEAVKASLDRARGEESTVKAELAAVVDVRVTNPLEIEIEVDGGGGALLGALADRAGMIISPAALASPDLNVQPVGSGPYEVTEYRVDDRVTYTKFDDYWDPEVQRVAGMEYRIIADEQTRLNALQSGELDMMVTSVSRVTTTMDAGFNVLAGLGPSFIGLTVNASREPFDDPQVRQALYQAIDQEAIANELLGGLCEPQIQYWPSTSWAYDDDLGAGLEVWPYDPEEAQSLLAEAGLPDGFEFTMLVGNVPQFTAIAEVLQQYFADIGVTMNIEAVDAAQVYTQYRVEKTVDASIEVYVASPDPDGVMTRALLPDALGNPGGASNDAIVDLAAEARSAIDQDERADLYHDLTAELIDFVPHIGVICMQYRTEAFVDGVSGLSINVSGARDFRGVAISD